MPNKHFPKITYLDGFRFQRAILAGFREVISREKELNRINVFPIPDRDTGSNLKKTFSPILDKFPAWQPEINLTTRNIAEAAVNSASGYSGIIFAQFFLGYAEGVKDSKRVLAKDFAKALDAAVSRAYESIEGPVEGTILTVFREWSEEMKRLSEKERDFAVLLRRSLEAAKQSLAKTPEKLQVLKKHRVVDAGGQAFVYFLDGIVKFMEKGKLFSIVPSKENAVLERKIFKNAEGARFCAECCVRGEKIDRLKLIEEVNTLGSDLMFYGTSGFAKIHIRTVQPESVFSCAARFGAVSSEKIFDFEPGGDTVKKNTLALVADTTCDIPEEHIEHNNIYFVPVKIQVSERTFMDKVDLIPEEFYQMMTSFRGACKTSQPSFMDFSRIYEHLLAHYQSIISLQLSGKLSGTFQTSLQAARSIDPQRISVVDGKSISVGLGLEMLEGFRAIREGLSWREVLARVKETVNNLEVLIGIPTLKYLVRGGRVRKAKGLIGSILNINPILSIGREGILEPTGKTRGKKKLVEEVLNLAFARMRKVKEIYGRETRFSLAVAHTNAPHLGQRVVEEIWRETGLKISMVMNASPVLGAHAGPGAVGLAFLRTSH